MNDQHTPDNSRYPNQGQGNVPGNAQRWHGQQPSPYTQQGHLPPAPPYVAPAPKKNWFLRHKILTGIGALLIVGIAAGAASGGGSGSGDAATSSSSSQEAGSQDSGAQAAANSDSAGASTKATTQATTQAAQKKEAAPGLNTPVRDGKFEFTVTKVQTGVKSVGDQYLNQQAQGQYVLISVTVKNIGDKPQTMFDSNQELTDAQGRTFSPDSTAAIYMKNNNIWMKEINPGNTMTGTLVYDMPTDAKPASIELHDSMFSGGTKVSLAG